jgi:hypothetical protein
LTDALYEIDKSLVRNWHNHKGRALKAAVLRKMNRKEEAIELDRRFTQNRFVQFRLSFSKSILFQVMKITWSTCTK